MALLIRAPEGLEPSRTARCSARVYHCFDRIVLQGYIPLLTRPEHIVHFFRDVHGLYPITPEVLAKRTAEYRGWVEGYARNHKVPVVKAEKGVSKENLVRPHLQRMERRNQHGVYFIFASMEMGSTFRSQAPRFPTDDPDYRIIRRVPSRFLHYYFYIRDPVIGPLAMCVGTYLPFQTTYYLNGHNFIEIELRRQGVGFRKDDNAFLSTSDPKALQAAADKLSPAVLEKRLNYWSWLLAPKFSDKDRKAVNLQRNYSINQAEYCRNFVFKRNFPIHKIFERSCEMSLFRLAADKVAHIFGVRVNRRMRGKLHSLLEKLDHGHHVLRIYCRNLVGRMYEKFSTFLRVEVCVNRMKDLGLKKGLENLPLLRKKLVAITDRFAAFEAESLNVHVDFPLFQKIALPVTSGKTKIAGIKIHDTRMMRLMEVFLHAGTQLNGWRSSELHEAILTTFGLTAEHYTLTQLRYDLRKMKAHGLIERHAGRYLYQLTDKGTKASLMFVLFHKRVCGPLANSLFHHRPDNSCRPSSRIETAYHKADRAIQEVLNQLAA
jgi:hypothetical protein